MYPTNATGAGRARLVGRIMKLTSKARPLSASALAAVMAGSLLAGPVSAQAPQPPGECPATTSSDDLTAGMMGTGWTVSKGTEPEPFSAEVLGVMHDALGPGKNMVIVEASSPAIERAGGVWAGMSGSPVYVDDKLIGVIAYGLTWGPSKVAGMTAAEDIVRLAERPSAGPSAAAARVRLDDATAEAVSEQTGSSRTSYNMERLQTPVSVSGAGPRAMRALETAAEREGLPIIPLTGTSVSSSEQSPTPPRPGGNFAGAASYGDITFAGVGTTSYVCEGRAVAFGHPFLFPGGQTYLGANDARALTVVPDSAGTPYKLANITGAFGILDQDRFSGIRALLGPGPVTIPVSSTVVASGGQRDGVTEIIAEEAIPFLSFLHLLTNIDSTRDQISEGTSTMAWTLTGTTESGEPFSLTRDNRFAGSFDVAFDTLIELQAYLFLLLRNGFEEVSVSGLDADVSIEDTFARYTLGKVEVSNDGVNFSEARRVRIGKGGTVHLKVELLSEEVGGGQTLEYAIEVPKNVRRRAQIEIGHQDPFGESLFFCIFEPSACAPSLAQADSFQELLAELEGRPRNDDMVVLLRGTRKVRAEDIQRLDEVIHGFKRITVVIGAGGGRGGKGGGSSPPSAPIEGG